MMKLKPYEAKVLFKKKMIEGKSPDEADWEIERDNAVQENVKCDFQWMKNRVRALEKENELLNKQLSRTIIPQEEIVVREKQIKINDQCCSVKYLTRIMNFLTENPNSTQSNIAEAGMQSDRVKEGLLFLTKHNLVILIKKGSVKLYSLP